MIIVSFWVQLLARIVTKNSRNSLKDPNLDKNRINIEIDMDNWQMEFKRHEKEDARVAPTTHTCVGGISHVYIVHERWVQSKVQFPQIILSKFDSH